MQLDRVLTFAPGPLDYPRPQKGVALILRITAPKAMEVGSILSNDRCGRRQALAIGVEMICLTEEGYIALHRLLSMSRLRAKKASGDSNTE